MKSELWLQMLHEAVAEETPSAGPHIVDDDGILDGLESGQLSPAQHESLVAHLAECGSCREGIAVMIRTGLLTLPGTEEVDGTAPVTKQIERQASRPGGLLRFWPRIALTAVACAVLVLLYFQTGHDVDTRLAMLERELPTHPREALHGLSELMEEPLPNAARMKAISLAEDAGYLVARDQLQAGDFRSVSETERRVRQWGATSARLANLRLRAGQGATSELALAGAGALTDYGYELTGRNLTKSALPEPDPTQARWEKDFRAAIEEFPHDPTLRLNLGHLLLKQGRIEEAIEMFRSALELNQDDANIRIALGLALFEWQDYERALQQFQAAAEAEPGSFAAHLNAAIALQRLKRIPEARMSFEQAEKLATSADQRARIRRHLDGLN